MTTRTDVLVVGGGPAGLAAATELRRLGVADVTVVEREAVAGGVPRHCEHPGFGWFDLRRCLSGPAYARSRVARAEAAGVRILTSTTALGRADDGTLLLTGPDGLRRLDCRALLLATGCRERPRAARLVPGDRPAGVLTTGSLQQLVYLAKARVGRRAVVVGAEHVSYSAVQTLWHGGADVAALVTPLPASQTYWPVHAYFAGLRGVPLRTGRDVTRILGGRRVEAVELSPVGGGPPEVVACDTVVFTGDWIPDHELARSLAVPLDRGTRGPAVDGWHRTVLPRVFAAGNAVHAAEMADFAALGGIDAARSVHRFLLDGAVPSSPGVPVVCAAPLVWSHPNLIRPGSAPRRYVLRVAAFVRGGTLVVAQDGRTLATQRFGRLVPNRSLAARAGFEDQVDPAGGPVTFTLDRVSTE